MDGGAGHGDQRGFRDRAGADVDDLHGQAARGGGEGGADRDFTVLDRACEQVAHGGAAAAGAEKAGEVDAGAGEVALVLGDGEGQAVEAGAVLGDRDFLGPRRQWEGGGGGGGQQGAAAQDRQSGHCEALGSASSPISTAALPWVRRPQEM